MDYNAVFSAMNEHGVRYLLIGGVNFMLRHKPYLTLDVDLWIEDTAENREKCAKALAAINAEWGATEDDWRSVTQFPGDWLATQGVFSLNSKPAAVDIFRSVMGLGDWQESWDRSVEVCTDEHIVLRALCDTDMLRCQEALASSEQKLDRMRVLRDAIKQDQTP